MKESTEGRKNGIQWTLWKQLDDLDFANDIALLAHTYQQMQEKTTKLEKSATKLGFSASKAKTKCMRMNTTSTTPIMLQTGDIEDVSSILGSTVSTTRGTDDAVKARTGKVRVGFNILQKIWKSRDITTSVKLQLFNRNVKSVLLYGSQTWRTSKSMLRKVRAFINKCLRRILRIRWPEKVRNEELWERTGQEPVKSVISRRKWSWIGHTLRKPKDNITKQALRWNPSGKRSRGRRKHTWRRGMEAEMAAKGYNFSGLEKMAQNRVRWKLIVDGLCSTPE